MSFVQPQANPLRSSVGIGVAVVFHVGLIWALMNGLAHHVMAVINAPIETQIIEQIKPPPPPKVEVPPPPRPAAPPPPAYTPPPEVPMAATPAPQATITATTQTAPSEPPPVAPRVEPPPAPPAPAAPAPKPVAAPVSASVACSNYSRVMGDAAFPRAATRLGLEEGDALIQFTLGATGEIRDIKAIHASHAVFAENSIRLVGAFRCAGRGADVTVQVPFAYKSE